MGFPADSNKFVRTKSKIPQELHKNSTEDKIIVINPQMKIFVGNREKVDFLAIVVVL